MVSSKRHWRAVAKEAEQSRDFARASTAWRMYAEEANDAIAYCSLCRFEISMRHWHEAEKAHTMALNIDAGFRMALLMGAVLYLSREDGERIENAQHAKRLSVEALAIECDVDGLNLLGSAEFMLGHYDDAEIAFQRAIDCDSNNEEAYMNLGTVYAVKREFAEAERCVKKALELDPEYAEANSCLNRILKDKMAGGPGLTDAK